MVPAHGLVPTPGVSPSQWSRAAVEAMDADAIRAVMPSPPVSGGAAADRIATALGTPNQIQPAWSASWPGLYTLTAVRPVQ
ncbi:hypothetical protein GCM10010259_69200 [Streptomyces daghestanicus]|uniref:Uncharacterized protein n=2 Tax=Streptomyces daghestanicus TaxID=66885 RepID=A0ABQ3Q7A6_9ACTN|nr:hypothetical protein GCM10010259_69200 [Streptomyces daghestanicus]GHI33165.1 hypothetical protein Sdagh_48950 [Streptomyces daghestanicus]